MGSLSLVHWLIVILVVILLFGRGRISDLMGDMAKGINSFKKGLADDGAPPAPPAQGYGQPPQPYPPAQAYVPPHLAPPAAPVQPTVRDEVPRS
ncbi:MAG: twin-arginine translocase TatA/TatE family subunit [Janthinobacterium lividum]